MMEKVTRDNNNQNPRTPVVDIEKYCETVGLELGSWKEDRQGQEVTGSKKWAKKQSLVDN